MHNIVIWMQRAFHAEGIVSLVVSFTGEHESHIHSMRAESLHKSGTGNTQSSLPSRWIFPSKHQYMERVCCALDMISISLERVFLFLPLSRICRQHVN